jgi:hypothetical protein
MKNSLLQAARTLSIAVLLAAIAACTPAHDWREVQGSAAPFSVLLPAKPTILARQIDLDGMPVTMTMTAAEVGGVTYAVGTVDLPDAASAKRAMTAMRTAMVRNIHGTVVKETAADSSIALEASGTPTGGQPKLLIAHFVASNQHAYQVIVAGAATAIAREQVDTFMSSFKAR